jgi:uncharacterized metal-binding protein
MYLLTAAQWSPETPFRQRKASPRCSWQHSMPDGKTHSAITMIVGVPLSIYLARHFGGDGTAAGIGALVGLVVTPDLDLVNTMSTLPVIGRVWGAVWWPYRKTISHRSISSHFPVIGTVIRVVYICVFVFAPMLLMGAVVNVNLLWCVVGLSISDTLHALADVLIKEKRRR